MRNSNSHRPLRSVTWMLAAVSVAGLAATPLEPAGGAPAKTLRASGRDAGGAAGSAAGAAAGPAAVVPTLPAFAIVSRPDTELLLFELRLNGRVLSESLSAYPVPGGMVVPLGELCRLLELAIQVDPRKGWAQGTILRPQNSFRLDAAKATARLRGQELPYPRTQVEVHEDDIYVDTRLLALWLPVDVKLDERGALLDLNAKEQLPIQDRWARENRLIRTPEDPAKRFKDYQRIEVPYRFVDLPWVDQTLLGRYQPETPTTPTAKPTNRFRLASQTYLGGDFLWMSAQGYANFQDPGGLHDQRLTLGRRDPEGGLLGPLNAREFQIGDTVVPGVGLASMTAAGPGFLVSNFPLEAQGSQDRRTFIGNLPPGWQVELYQNGSLIGFQVNTPDGRYQFLDVPIQFGPNDFRLVFYGPGGERREEVVRVNQKELRTPKGDFRYRVAGVSPHYLPKRGAFEAEVGLTNRFVLQASAVSLGLIGIDQTPAVTDQKEYQHTYAQVGLRGYWDLVIGRASFSHDSRTAGNAAEVGLETGFASGSTLSVSHAELKDYASEIFRPIYGPIQSRTLLSLYGSLPDLRRPWGSYQLDLQHDALAQGGSYDRVGNRLSTSVASFSFSNTLNWTRLRDYPGKGQDSNFVNGAFLLGRSFGVWSLRGQANYTLNGGVKHLTDTALYADTTVFHPFQLQAGINRSTDSGTTTYLLNVFKYTGRFSLGLNAAYSSESHFTGAITLHVGLSHDPSSGTWRARAENVVGFGGLSARAFQDKNGNGRRDPGEPYLEEAGFAVSGIPNGNAVGANYFSDRMPADRYAYASLLESSLEDPLARPATAGYKLLPRSGRVATIEVPVVNFGQVNGTVYLDDGGPKRAFPGLQVELIDHAGRVVKAVRTAYDGFFSLDGVKPGIYQLRVSPPDLDRLELVGPAPKAMTLDPTGTIVDNADLIVRSLHPAIPRAPMRAAAPPALPVPSNASAPDVTSLTARASTSVPTRPQVGASLRGLEAAFTLRVMVASLPETVARTMAQLKPVNPDVFAEPKVLRNGERCTQVFVGHFETRGAAERFVTRLPAEYQTRSNRPVVTKLSDLHPAPALASMPPPSPVPPVAPSTSAPSSARPAQTAVAAVRLPAPAPTRAVQDVETYTLRVMVAAMPQTVGRTLDVLKSVSPEVFTKPIQMRNGQQCTQIFVGSFPSKVAAEYFVKNLPPEYQTRANRPLVCKVSELPVRQS